MRLEQMLVDEGLLSQDECDKALEISKESYRPLPEVLVKDGYVEEGSLLKVQAKQHGLEFVHLSEITIEPSVIKTVSAKLASHYMVIPVSMNTRSLCIAVSNPLDMSPAEDIETNLGYRVERVLACSSDIQKALKKQYIKHKCMIFQQFLYSMVPLCIRDQCKSTRILSFGRKK